MSLGLLHWGGTIYSATTGGAALEVWSNSLAIIDDGASDETVVLNQLDTLVKNYVTGAETYIHPTVALEFVKYNRINILTGRQITDPTAETQYVTANRGGGGSTKTYPLTTSCRVSIDNGTRNRKTRGGFYLPRVTMPVQDDGRFADAQLDYLITNTATFLTAVNNVTDLTVGVWSRADKSVTAATRFRVGDVPDNISRRKNNLTETYQVHTI